MFSQGSNQQLFNILKDNKIISFATFWKGQVYLYCVAVREKSKFHKQTLFGNLLVWIDKIFNVISVLNNTKFPFSKRYAIRAL